MLGASPQVRVSIPAWVGIGLAGALGTHWRARFAGNLTVSALSLDDARECVKIVDKAVNIGAGAPTNGPENAPAAGGAGV